MARLKAFKDVFRRDPVRREKYDQRLGEWLINQKSSYDKLGTKKYDPVHLAQLKSVGVNWASKPPGAVTVRDLRFPHTMARFEEMIHLLKEYKEEFGMFANPSRTYPKDKDKPQVGLMLAVEKRRYDHPAGGNYPTEKLRRLREIGVDWALFPPRTDARSIRGLRPELYMALQEKLKNNESSEQSLTNGASHEWIIKYKRMRDDNGTSSRPSKRIHST
jgi:hypothetical protein